MNAGTSTGRAWNSDEDSGAELTENDFQPAATTTTRAVQPEQKRKLQYGPGQLHSELSTGTLGRSSPATFVTQPTQPLQHTTQPTQPLPKQRSPEVQVERSSPVAASPVHKPVPPPITRAPFARPNGILAKSMAPPGTAFRRPPGVQAKPASIDVDDSDDDPPINHSDDEAPTSTSNIKPTNFKRAGRGLDSSPNRVIQESPRAQAPVAMQRGAPTAFMGMLSKFGYEQPAPQTPMDDMGNAYGSTSRPPRQQIPGHQTAPSRAMPVSSAPVYQRLEDVEDYVYRGKVVHIQRMLPNSTVQHCMDALTIKKGSINDALNWLVEQEEAALQADELSQPLSPIQRKGVAKPAPQSSLSRDSSQPIRPLAKQHVRQPVQTIAERYNANKKRATVNEPIELDSDDEEIIKPNRGRLVQGIKGGRSPSSSPPRPAPRRNRLAKKAVVTIDSDSEDEGVGPDASADEFEDAKVVHVADEDQDPSGRMQEIREARLLKIFNESTVHDLAELSGQPNENIQFVLDQRPFDSLDDVRLVVMETLTKTGKKSKRSRALGDKLVDDCTEVMTGYDAVDQLVVQCEQIAKPLLEALKGWGVNGDGEGELQIMNLDAAHDSGIGTPASSCTAEEKTASSKPKSKFLGQPKVMSPDLVMKDYQLVGLNWLDLLFQKKLSCILADDMGLGKTCQVIAFLSHLQMQKVDGVHLIIVPGSTLENWLREFERFAPELNVRPYYGLQKEREELRLTLDEDFETIDVIVTTYDMATSAADNRWLRKYGPFSVCVYDEAHMLRNPKSNRYQQLMRIGADFKLLLTGTPLQNNLQELVAILAFIMPDLFTQKAEDLDYIFKHKASTKDTAHAALLSGERIARARTMMTPFILRRKKHQVLDLPKKESRVEWCNMTDDQADHYAQILSEAQQYFEDKASGAIKGTASHSSNVIMKLRKAAIHPLLSNNIYNDQLVEKIVKVLSKSEEFGGNSADKIRAYLNGKASDQVLKGGDFGIHRFCNDRDYLRKRFALKKQEWMDSGKVKVAVDLILKWKANGDRILLFSQFTTVMDILETVCETSDIPFMRLDGQTKMDIRQGMIDTFTNDTSIPLFMLSTKAGGAGINLAAANKVIIFDSGFNPQDDIQAENRAHRVGQTREVEVVRLVTRGTIEEQIHALGESKLALDDRVAGEAASAAESTQAEKAGEQLVENMLAQKIAKGTKEEKADANEDLKDAFKSGLEDEGVKVQSKQAQF